MRALQCPQRSPAALAPSSTAEYPSNPMTTINALPLSQRSARTAPQNPSSTTTISASPLPGRPDRAPSRPVRLRPRFHVGGSLPGRPDRAPSRRALVAGSAHDVGPPPGRPDTYLRNADGCLEFAGARSRLTRGCGRSQITAFSPVESSLLSGSVGTRWPAYTLPDDSDAMRLSSAPVGSFLGRVRRCGLPDRGDDRLCRALGLGACQGVGDSTVDVGGEGVAGVSEQVLHGVQAGLTVQRVHRGPVSQIVQPDRRQPALGDQGGEPGGSASPDGSAARPATRTRNQPPLPWFRVRCTCVVAGGGDRRGR